MSVKNTEFELNRVRALSDYCVCNSKKVDELESITRVAAYLCKTPFAMIAFAGEDQHWIKAHFGLEAYPDFLQAFAKHKPKIVSPLDEEHILANSAVCEDLNISFFAATPLINPDGFHLGSLCVMDKMPRQLDKEQKETLEILSNAAISFLETTKKNSELQQLLSEAQKFHHLFNNSSEIHCITNSEGKIEFINDSIEQLLGYSSHEVVGRNIWDFTVPGERESHMPAIQSAILGGKDTFQIETRVTTKTGEVRWFSWSDVIKEGYWLVNGRDITEVKEKELQLQTLSLAVEKSSVGVMIRNDKYEVEWMNGALEGIIGYQLDELKGKPMGHLLKGKDTDLSVFKTAKQALKDKVPYEIEIVLYKKDGTPVWLFLSNNQLYNANNEIEKHVCIAVDITERKKAEFEMIKTRDDALRLGNAKENFLSVMSHEMRTPLNAVIGVTRMLMDESPMEYQKENLNILKFSSENLLTLINDVLDFTKIETGNLQLEKIPFNVKELVKNTLDSLRFKTSEKNIALISSIDPHIPDFILGDSTRLYQIFMNLLGNAVKFTEEGEVELALSLTGNAANKVSIKCVVRDTGIGIAPEKIDSIFDAYTQAGADISRKYGGTGLGLTITKKLIELQDSEIFVESELGKGTTFSFTLNFEQADRPEPITTTSTAFNKYAKILLVDDNAMNRLLAKKLFDKWEIPLAFAENGVEAVQKIEENNYDLVFMDIHMPVLDGFEATKQIRSLKEERFKQLPVIALTASVLKDDENKFELAGMNDFLLKPFGPESILKVLNKYLD